LFATVVARIFLSNNHITSNKVSVCDGGSLSNLESLELRENVLKYLPSSFAFLIKLKRLDLGANMFDELVS
jgi:protein scribble